MTQQFTNTEIFPTTVDECHMTIKNIREKLRSMKYATSEYRRHFDSLKCAVLCNCKEISIEKFDVPAYMYDVDYINEDLPIDLYDCYTLIEELRKKMIHEEHSKNTCKSCYDSLKNAIVDAGYTLEYDLLSHEYDIYSELESYEDELVNPWDEIREIEEIESNYEDIRSLFD